MEKKKLIKNIINIVGRVLMLLSLIFVGRAIYRLGLDFSAIDNLPLFVLEALGFAALFALGVFIQAFAWKGWLDFFSGAKGRSTHTKEALCVYAKANIGKYLPGNVMHYVERNLFAAKSGASQTGVALSSVFEIVSQVAVAFLLALICRGGTIFEVLDAIFPGGWRRYVAVAVGVMAVIFAAALILALKHFSDRIRSILSDYSPGAFVITLIKTMLLYMSVMLIGGAILAAVYGIISGRSLSVHDLFLIVPGYVIAWVLGFVVPGAPGGIGVREFVLTMLLGPVMGEECVITVMVIHRLINILGDFLAYLVQFLVGNTPRDERSSEPDESSGSETGSSEENVK